MKPRPNLHVVTPKPAPASPYAMLSLEACRLAQQIAADAVRLRTDLGHVATHVTVARAKGRIGELRAAPAKLEGAL